MPFINNLTGGDSTHRSAISSAWSVHQFDISFPFEMRGKTYKIKRLWYRLNSESEVVVSGGFSTSRNSGYVGATIKASLKKATVLNVSGNFLIFDFGENTITIPSNGVLWFEFNFISGGNSRLDVGGGYTTSYYQNNTFRTGKTAFAIEYGDNNAAPTQPGNFTEQPSINSINLSGEIVNLSWGASTDKEGDPITYEVEFYNGSTWSVVGASILQTSFSYSLPVINTESAKLRVRAKDSDSYSEYTYSNTFKVYRYLILIQDNGKAKTYKDGKWQSI